MGYGYPGKVLSTAPLTWGQLANFRYIEETGIEPALANMVREVRLDRTATTVAEVIAALRVLMERHEALCTVMDGRDPRRPKQVLLGDPDVPYLTCTPEEYPQVFDSRRRENLITDSALVWKAIICVEAGHVVKLTLLVHHIIGDGFSLSVIIGELRKQLAGLALPAHPAVQPREMAAQQQSTETQKRVTDYFRRYHAAAPSPAERPDRFSELASSTKRIDIKFTDLIPYRTLRAGAKKYHVTPATLALMTTILLLGTLVDSPTGAINLVAGNRVAPAVRRTVDCFAQSIPIVYRMTTDQDLASVAENLHRDAMQAYFLGNWSVDAEKEMRDSLPQGDLRRLPKFTFNYNASGNSAQKSKDTAADHAEDGRGTAIGSVLDIHDTEYNDWLNIVLNGAASDGSRLGLRIGCSTYLAPERRIALMGRAFRDTVDYLATAADGTPGRLMTRIGEILNPGESTVYEAS